MTTQPRTDTATLAAALDVLARDIDSPDGIATAAIAEAAERLRELMGELTTVRQYAAQQATRRRQIDDEAHDYAEQLRQMTAERDELRQQVDRLGFLRDNLMTDANVFRSRAEAAEARLKALCEADPVAVVDREAVGRVFWLSIIPDGTLLIRRPEMP